MSDTTAIGAGAMPSISPAGRQHRSYATTAVLTSVAFLEATVNEVFEDTTDDRHVGQRVEPLEPRVSAMLASFWESVGNGRYSLAGPDLYTSTRIPDVKRRPVHMPAPPDDGPLSRDAGVSPANRPVIGPGLPKLGEPQGRRS